MNLKKYVTWKKYEFDDWVTWHKWGDDPRWFPDAWCIPDDNPSRWGNTEVEKGRIAVQSSSQYMLPSGYVKIAIENGHRNSEFSH
jgi:hypothetical protein